ncbi:Ribbon-helix-helix protein, copG family [Novosphingobium sp. B1]|nr:Ribbon-helix-helix protein, copG family [Novosphingobium sp. B1]
MSGGHVKRSVRLSADLARALADHARTRKASQTAIIEAALASFLSPDAADRLEASLSRRLDRMTRDIARLQWHAELTAETLAIFIRFWLTNHVASPDSQGQAAQAIGRERWERFVETLARRMETGSRLEMEIDRIGENKRNS